MRFELLLLTISMAFAAIAEPVFAQGPLILPSRRQDAGFDEQNCQLFVEATHSWYGGDNDGGNIADDAFVDDGYAVGFNGIGLNTFAESIGGASCSTATGSLSYGPVANAFGAIVALSNKVSAIRAGTTFSLQATTAQGRFQIERHPNKDSEGSENNAPVTVFGRLIMAFYGGNSGGVDFGVNSAIVSVGNSNLTALYWGEGLGWTVTGNLSQSSSEDPFATAWVVNENHFGGMDIDYDCTQIAWIGTTINIIAQMNGLGAFIDRDAGGPVGFQVVQWDYSLAASYYVLDEEL